MALEDFSFAPSDSDIVGSSDPTDAEDWLAAPLGAPAAEGAFAVSDPSFGAEVDALGATGADIELAIRCCLWLRGGHC